MSRNSANGPLSKARPRTEFERRHFIYLTGVAGAAVARKKSGR